MNAVGQPISRIDGRLKVTGSARYTADIPVEAIVHGATVYSTIANGRTVSIDTAAAENAPGVLDVLTHKNMPRMNQQSWSLLRPQGQTYLPLQNDRIYYAGQPLALVIAATLDQANYAGTLIKVAYEARPPVVFDLRTAKEDAVEPPQRMWPLSSSVGDADRAIAGAAVKIEQTYTMSDRHHNPMEPHVTFAGLGRGRLADTTTTPPRWSSARGSWFRSSSVFRRRKSTSCANSWAADSAANPGRGRTLCWPRSPRKW